MQHTLFFTIVRYSLHTNIQDKPTEANPTTQLWATTFIFGEFIERFFRSNLQIEQYHLHPNSYLIVPR